jgi:hypothetical protein
MINPDVGSRRTSQAFSSEGSEGVNDVGRGEYSEHEDAEEEVEDRSFFGNIHCTGTMKAFDQNIDADLEADLEAALRESMGTTTPLSTLGATPNVEEEEYEEDDSGDESLEGDEGGDDEAGSTPEIDEDENCYQAFTTHDTHKTDLSKSQRLITMLGCHHQPCIRCGTQNSCKGRYLQLRRSPIRASAEQPRFTGVTQSSLTITNNFKNVAS